METENVNQEADTIEVYPQEDTQEVDENHEDETETVSEQDDLEENESEDSETSDDDEENDDEDGDEDEKEAKPKKNGFKRRVDKLKSKITKAEEEAEYWRKQALKSAKEDEKAPVETKKDDTPELERPDPNNFDDHDEYLEALIEYKADLKFQKREEQETLRKEQRKREEAEVQKATSWQKRVNEFEESNPDFVDVCESAEDVAFSNSVRDAIIESDLGPAVLYELAQNPDEAERISGLSDIAAIREIGKIEGRLSGTSRKRTKTTKAPNPITPNRGTAKVTKDLSDPNLSQAEYERLRAKQLAAR